MNFEVNKTKVKVSGNKNDKIIFCASNLWLAETAAYHNGHLAAHFLLKFAFDVNGYWYLINEIMAYDCMHNIFDYYGVRTSLHSTL